jgi:hypothetical protein
MSIKFIINENRLITVLIAGARPAAADRTGELQEEDASSKMFQERGEVAKKDSIEAGDTNGERDITSSSSSTSTSTFRNTDQHAAPARLIAMVPAKPDLTIGEMIRSILPKPELGDNDSTAASYSPLTACSPTSQIRISSRTTFPAPAQRVPLHVRIGENREDSHFTQQSSAWIVEALDEDGNRKTVGGDEFYITFLHSNAPPPPADKRFRPTAIAIPVDYGDGTYLLDFVEPSLGGGKEFPIHEMSNNGTLRVDFVYTCSIGRMTRPSKDKWAEGGYLRQKSYTVENMTAPHVRAFPEPGSGVDLSKFEKVICFGDSLIGNMCGKFGDKFIFRQKKVENLANAGSKVRGDLLYNETFPLLEEWHGKDLRKNDTSVALLLGSAAWELSSNEGPFPGHFFTGSVQMYHDLIIGIRERYPNVSIFWKSPSAVHMTEVIERCYEENSPCLERVRYISNGIAKYLYDEQKRIMEELNVPFLDVWNATYVAGYWHMSDDVLLIGNG